MGLFNKIAEKLYTSPTNSDSTKSRYSPVNKETKSYSRNSNKLNLSHMSTMINEITNNGLGFSLPVFGPNVSISGDYSREGYASQTFDTPPMSFKQLALVLEQDEDARQAINHLTSMITGGSHYWKATTDEYGDYLNKISKQIDFDWLDSLMVQEALWYGNTVWKPRMGIANVRNKEDLLWIPISSLKRVWWDRQRQPYVYEFRGPQYQGYHQVRDYFKADINAMDLIHIVWNPVDASVFGTGLGVPICIQREYQVNTTDGLDDRRSTSLIDQKLQTRDTMLKAQSRYLTRNVYSIPDGEDDDVTALRSDLKDLEPLEDVVAGNKIEVQELGSVQREFDPTLHSDLIKGPIMQSLGTNVGKQSGESSHTYANAETAKEMEQIGLSSFPLIIGRQIQDQLFKPIYESMPTYDPMYYSGMLAVPWEHMEPELIFGRQEKKTIETDQAIKLLEIAMQSRSMPDPLEVRQILSDLGLPVKQKYTDQLNSVYNNYQVMPPYMQQPQADFSTYGADQAPRPQDTGYYTPDANNPNPRYPQPLPDGQPVVQSYPNATVTPGMDPRPSDPRANFDAISRVQMTTKDKKGNA
jgi:hypothetical protein